MQKAPPKTKSAAARARKSGRASFDKSGKGIWEWQTATGVFEQNITDEQLAELENSQLTFIGERKEPASVSYFEFRAQSNTPNRNVAAAADERETSPFKRWLGRWKRK
jgi:hypothetical protein